MGEGARVRVVAPGSAAWRAVAPYVALGLVAMLAGPLAARWRGGGREPERQPWQRSFLSLEEAGQRTYRAVREGLLEAEAVRAATKAWPEVAPLVEQGVPPFAPDGLGPELTWRRFQDGLYVTYVGEPARGAGARWLVLFIEPEKVAFRTPGEAPPPEDEEHHTLSDGTALHVTVWTQDAASGPAPTGVVAFPVAEGWAQVVGR